MRGPKQAEKLRRVSCRDATMKLSNQQASREAAIFSVMRPAEEGCWCSNDRCCCLTRCLREICMEAPRLWACSTATPSRRKPHADQGPIVAAWCAQATHRVRCLHVSEPGA